MNNKSNAKLFITLGIILILENGTSTRRAKVPFLLASVRATVPFLAQASEGCHEIVFIDPKQ